MARRHCRPRECRQTSMLYYEINTCKCSPACTPGLQRQLKHLRRHRTVTLTYSSRYQHPPPPQLNRSRKCWKPREYIPSMARPPHPLLSRIPTCQTTSSNSICISPRLTLSTGNFSISPTATWYVDFGDDASSLATNLSHKTCFEGKLTCITPRHVLQFYNSILYLEAILTLKCV